jgi:hypothetical protein
MTSSGKTLPFKIEKASLTICHGHSSALCATERWCLKSVQGKLHQRVCEDAEARVIAWIFERKLFSVLNNKVSPSSMKYVSSLCGAPKIGK